MAGTPLLQADQLIGASGQPAFQNGASNGTWGQGAGFWKDYGGVVHLTGSIATTTGTTIMFTLPAGYRPIPAGGNTQYLGTLAAGGSFTYISVDNLGNVWCASALKNIQLEGISFKARA